MGLYNETPADQLMLRFASPLNPKILFPTTGFVFPVVSDDLYTVPLGRVWFRSVRSRRSKRIPLPKTSEDLANLSPRALLALMLY